jgi:hypothetical protein
VLILEITELNSGGRRVSVTTADWPEMAIEAGK